MSELLDQARRVAERALALGAQDSIVSISRSRGVDLEWRDGQIERLQDQTERALSFSVYVDGRYSVHSTCDLREEAIEQFLQKAIGMTRLLEEDPCRTLPDPARYLGRAETDLDLFDPQYHQVSGDQRRLEVKELEELARAASAHLGDQVVSISSCVGDGHSQSARVHTNGFEGERESSSFYANVGVNLKEPDGKRPVGGASTYRRHRGDLRSLEEIANEASQKAEAKLGAQKLNTGKYMIIIENRAVGRLLGALLSPLGGAALQQRRSLWEGKLNEQIASPLLTVYDAPHLPRGLGSALWDGDGFATQRRPIIEEGVLKTFLINHYYANKMARDQEREIWATGGSLHNLEWVYGEHSLKRLIQEVGDGVFIDRFLGGNSNGTTGEVSLGCGGRMIRDGVLTEPLTEMNLGGHLGELWSSLSLVGSDPHPEGSARCPSCVFEGVQLSGV